MLLTISTSHKPAQDLGYLLHKHPDQAKSFELSFGQAHVFYPKVEDHFTTAALLLEIDPVGLVRNRKNNSGEALEQYVNDRPYVASSFLSVAIAEVLGTALAGKCKERPELAATAIELEASISCLPCPGEDFLRRLFEPLGYAIETEPIALDDNFSQWGQSRYRSLTLRKCCRLQELLQHLYVLIPVLDNSKHYWVGDDEVDKLMRHANQWLADHPEKELIARRYLRHKVPLTKLALERLNDGQPEPEIEEAACEEALEKPISLNEQRLNLVMQILKEAGATRVIDLGCGEGKLLKMLMRDFSFKELVGMDVSYRALELAQRRLKLEETPERLKERVKLIHGSLTYQDKRLHNFEAATCIEVIEHLDEGRLEALERVLFQEARPNLLIVTTPNFEYNQKFEQMQDKFRHKDHRFEWTRRQFEDWALALAAKHGYSVRFLPVGEEDPALGAPTQMGVFQCL